MKVKILSIIGILFMSLSLMVGATAQNISENEQLHPVIKEFKNLIEEDPIVRMHITKMIDQIPSDHKNIKDTQDLLSQLNQVLTKAPEYSNDEVSVCPISKIFVWAMCTPEGFKAFRNEKINMIIRKMLKTWGTFLNSSDSLYVFNDSKFGWESDEAKKMLHMEDYIYNQNDKYWGYKSWNDFFTRKIKPQSRPIASPDNNKIISSACDSTTYKISNNVKETNKFWIKSEPYSLRDMLDDSHFTKEFVGGSVYQAFLSPFNYHRWNSPVSGTIVKAYVKDGLYFSEAKSQGVDPSAQDKSQAYLTNVQTRAIFFIKADDPKIGLMCFMPVGMVEVSSCIIDPKIKPGYHVTKGEDLGYFQFGGSTNCLIFRHGVIKEFIAKENHFYKMGEAIAIAN